MVVSLLFWMLRLCLHAVGMLLSIYLPCFGKYYKKVALETFYKTNIASFSFAEGLRVFLSEDLFKSETLNRLL